MKNAAFRAQLEKLGFFQDPRAVAAANPDHARAIRRGLGIENAVGDAAAGAGKLLSGAGNLAERVMSSDPGVLSRAAGSALNYAGNLVERHPGAALGAAYIAPKVLEGFNQSKNKYEADLMAAYQDPDRVITASLDTFLEKKASAFNPTQPQFGMHVTRGVGEALGKGLIEVLGTHVGGYLSGMRNNLVDEPRRRKLLEQLFSADPVIKDALSRHPDSRAMLLEAYGTMVRFAPTLSRDINAARSFLREAVLGGAGVNYATIKNLVDTEKSITGNRGGK